MGGSRGSALQPREWRVDVTVITVLSQSQARDTHSLLLCSPPENTRHLAFLQGRQAGSPFPVPLPLPSELLRNPLGCDPPDPPQLELSFQGSSLCAALVG